MRRLAQKTVATALGLTLAVVPLTGCFGGKDKTDEPADDTTEQTVDATVDDGARTPTGNPDFNTWTTLGDAFAAATYDPSYGYDENYYLGTIPVNDRTIYVIARMTPELYNSFNDAFGDVAAGEAAISAVAIEYKEDITDKLMTQEQLDSFVGKTGQELLDAGFVFQSYTMYGAEETMATYDNGFYSYEFTFPVKTDDATAETDEGESLKAATVTAAETFGNTGNVCYSPTEFTQIPELAALGLIPSSTADESTDAMADGTEVIPVDGAEGDPVDANPTDVIPEDQTA